MSILTRENVVHYCRTCLTSLKKCEGKEEFKTRYKIQTTPNLSKWVEDFTSLKILMTNDEYPQHICEGCYCIFNSLNEFRILVCQSEDQLKDLLEVPKNEPNKISTTFEDDTDSSYQVNHQNDFKVRSAPATDFEETSATDALVTPKIEPLENNEADTNSSTFKDDSDSGYQVKNHQNEFKNTSAQATDYEETSATDAQQFKIEEEFEAHDTEFISSNINAQEKENETEKLLSDGSFEEDVELVKEEGVVGGWLQPTSSPTSQSLGSDTDGILFENSKLMQQTFSSTNQPLVLNEPLVTDSDDSTINIIPFQNSIELMRSEKNTDGINASNCQEISSSDESSSKHYTNKQRAHTGERPYVCDICNRAFIQSYVLKRHQRTHTGERPYVCDVCNRSFIISSDLKRHQLTHTGDKPYVCDICNLSCMRPYNLKRHQLTHTGEKSYVCDICNVSFKRPYNLKRHQRIHTGERPYVCDICQTSFAQLIQLKRHKRSEHEIPQNEKLKKFKKKKNSSSQARSVKSNLSQKLQPKSTFFKNTQRMQSVIE